MQLIISPVYHMTYIWPVIVSSIIAIVGIVLFRRRHILDKPGPDITPKRKPVPTIQGIFVFVALVIVIAVLFPLYLSHPVVQGLLAGGVILLVFETIEEWQYLHDKKLSKRLRLFTQVIAAVVAVYVSGIGLDELIIFDTVFLLPNRLFIVFFVVRSMLCINAINRFDGIYAQASGVSSIGFLTMFLLITVIVFPFYPGISAVNAATLTMIQQIAYILFVISLVYTVIEYKPRGLVRDPGIMLFGFAIAYLSVAGGTKIGTLLVVLSLVLLDAVRVGLHRIFVLKKNPLKGDYCHLHHRLLGLGRSRAEARAFVRIRSLVMMVLMLLQGANTMSKIIIFVMMALLFFGANAYLFWYKKLPCGLEMEKE